MTHFGSSLMSVWRAMRMVVVVVSLMLTACSLPNTGQTGESGGNVTTPTATSVPKPLTPSQAWGAYSSKTISLPLPSTPFFDPQDIFPDASTIVGVQGQRMQVVALTVANQKVRVLYTAPADLVTTLQVQTDGRYVAWAGGNVGEGATSQHNIAGYIDLQSGRVTTLADGNGFEQIMALTHGMLVWRSISAENSNASPPAATFITNLVANTTTKFSLGLDWNLVSVSWPYLLLNETNGVALWRLYNLSTGTFEPAPGLGVVTAGADGYAVAIDGSTAFWLSLPTGTMAQPAKLMQIDSIDQPSAASRVLYMTDDVQTIRPPQVNTRLVVWASVDYSNIGPKDLYVWDRVQHRLIAFDAKQYMNMPSFVVRDHALMIARNFGGGAGDITVIDTGTLSSAAHA